MIDTKEEQIKLLCKQLKLPTFANYADILRQSQRWAGRKILCKRFSTKSRMALESRADSGMNPLNTESHGGQNGMRAVSA